MANVVVKQRGKRSWNYEHNEKQEGNDVTINWTK